MKDCEKKRGKKLYKVNRIIKFTFALFTLKHVTYGKLDTRTLNGRNFEVNNEAGFYTDSA